MAPIIREQLRYGEPCESGQPLRVVARLSEGIVLRAPLMLDGLLAWAVSAEHRLLPPLAGELPAQIEIPIQREPGGRFHLCSESIYSQDAAELRYKNRRAPAMEFARLGSSKIKRVDIAAGANKGFRVPYSVQHLSRNEIAWYCLGDRRRIIGLLARVHYLGRHRGSGKGRLDLHGEPWRVEECEPWGPGFPVVDSDARPLRPLPLDWPGLANPIRQGFRTITYPYFDHPGESACAIP